MSFITASGAMALTVAIVRFHPSLLIASACFSFISYTFFKLLLIELVYLFLVAELGVVFPFLRLPILLLLRCAYFSVFYHTEPGASNNLFTVLRLGALWQCSVRLVHDLGHTSRVLQLWSSRSRLPCSSLSSPSLRAHFFYSSHCILPRQETRCGRERGLRYTL